MVSKAYKNAPIAIRFLGSVVLLSSNLHRCHKQVPRYLGDKEYHCLSDGEDLAPTLPPRGKVRRRSRSADFARVSCRGRHAFTSVSPSPSRSDLDISEWEVPEEDEINAVCASDMTKLDNLSVSCGKVYTNRGRIVSTFANKVRKPKAGPEPALQQDESQAWPDFRSSDKDQPPSKLRLHRQLYSQDTLLKMRPVGQQDDIEVRLTCWVSNSSMHTRITHVNRACAVMYGHAHDTGISYVILTTDLSESRRIACTTRTLSK